MLRQQGPMCRRR